MEEENKRLTEGFAVHEQNAQKLLLELNKQRARNQEYETIIYHSQLQLNQQHIPETTHGVERQKIL